MCCATATGGFCTNLGVYGVQCASADEYVICCESCGPVAYAGRTPAREFHDSAFGGAQTVTRDGERLGNAPDEDLASNAVCVLMPLCANVVMLTAS